MSLSPGLKIPLPTLLRLLAGAAAGFAAGTLIASITTPSTPAPDFGTESSILQPGGDSRAAALTLQKPLTTLPSAADFQHMEPGGKLNLALQLQGLSGEKRQEFLNECLRRPARERTSLLFLLLAEWAETQPATAAEWVLVNLKEPESSQCLNDVFRTWAVRDGQSLAEWTNARFKEKGRDITWNAMNALEQLSPLWFARISEMDCNRDSIMTGMTFDGLRAPGAAQAISSQLREHVAYTTDPAKLAQKYVEQWDEPQKWGWNRLFERTAVYWHAEDPAACDAWLEAFPGNARLAARRSIQEAAAQAEPPAAGNE